MRNHAVDHVHRDLAIDGRIDFAVLIQIVIAAAPALRLGFVAGLVEDARVDPPDRATEDAVAVERLVLVAGKLHVVRVEADVHLLELPRLRVEVLHLPEAALLRRERCRRMRSAERRLILRPPERDDIHTRPLPSIAA